MPESTNSLIEQVEGVVKYLVTAIIAIVAWVSNRQIRRMDVIEKNYASTDTLNKTVESLRADIRGIHKRLDNVISKL